MWMKCASREGFCLKKRKENVENCPLIIIFACDMHTKILSFNRLFQWGIDVFLMEGVREEKGKY